MTTTEDAGAQPSTPGSLYVVATPIGNLSDLSQRAKQTLVQADWVAAEDTRVSRKLVELVGSRADLVALHEHNEFQASDALIGRLLSGQCGALVSDAGTPAISDPGAILVAKAHAAGIRVIPVPGASAPVALLSAAGLPAGPFLFEGFLPSRRKTRQHRLAQLRDSTALTGAHLLLFEAPHRIVECLTDLLEAFGPTREVVIGRELTKHFEQVHRCPLAGANDWIAADSNRTRGEFVMAVAAPVRSSEANGEAPPAGTHSGDPEAEARTRLATARHEIDTQRLLSTLLLELPLSQAVELAEQLTGARHRELYQLALSMRKTV